ncbi:IS110 family transposase [Nocardia sp. NPDC047038]|uniref:IS110 family transposase n=1 Tax=Nocardia sp. NPDC047038 TaxID=3154338 RepID=UPI0033E538F2
MRFVGWDWASKTHDVTVIDDRGRVLDRWAFSHTEQAWTTTLARLARHGDPADLPVIIERTSGLIVDRLLAAGHPVVPVHPTAFHAARPRWGASGAKSDPGDSYKLADYLRTDGHRLRQLDPVDLGLRELQALIRLRDDRVQARTTAINQLASLLDNYWPRPKNLFCSLASPIALAFLTAYPTPQSAARLGEVRMAAFLRRNSLPRRKTRRTAAGPVTRRCRSGRPATTDTLALMIGTQVQLLRGIQTAIADLENLIRQRVGEHLRAQLLAALPGVGIINLAQLLAEIGPILDRVDTVDQAGAECGVTPVAKASGKTSGVYFRWAANTRAREAITAFAHNARMQSSWAAELYSNARASVREI